MMGNALTKRLKEQDISLELTDAALEKLLKKAMTLNMVLVHYVVHYKTSRGSIIGRITKGNVEKGNQVVIDYVNDEFVVKKKRSIHL